MESQRLILFFVFAFSTFMLLEGWQRDQHPAAPAPAVSDKGGKATPAVPSSVPSAPTAADKTALPQAAASQPAPRAAEKETTIKVETDLVVARIGTRGGDLRHLEFKKHRDTLDKSKDFVLFDDTPEYFYIAQTGLIGAGLPNHHSLFKASGDNFRLADGQDQLEVRLTAPAPDGVEVAKIYRFQRGSYLIHVSYEIANKSGAAVNPYAYYQLVRDGKPPAGGSSMLPTFTGVALFTEKDKFHKFSLEDIAKDKAKFPKTSNDGWIAVIQHYFLSAWLPNNGAPREFYMKKEKDADLYSAGMTIPVGAIAAGATTTLDVPMYAGPQEPSKLEKIAPGLDLTIDYGWLTVIAVPLFWVLSELHQLVGNWGLAIILLTVLIKLLFYPLSAASYRSMAKMRVVAPKLQKLKERYGDDRQRMQQAMMDLYKTEKINPLGGCMPIVVQIPVFIALYWVLLGSVELRHAPFGLGISDLTTSAVRDMLDVSTWASFPYFVLPILMAATMWIQTSLNPEPPDPVQAKVMKIMPLMFSFMFFFFPAGLVLYWLVNNVLSILQQWRITRVMEREGLSSRKN
jgi:YidC/Oxa1 family membrane protein insertase